MIRFAAEALEDLERILDVHASREPESAVAQVETIRRAVLILDEHPYLGRPVQGSEQRELIISVGKSGYAALYQFDEFDQVVRVLAVRHQREAGYRRR